MSDSLRRVSVYADHGGQPVTVDLALPADIGVEQLMPSIVRTFGADDVDIARRWRLSHVGGPALDDSMSLAQHGVHDGDLLLLSTAETPAPAPVFDDDPAAVAAAAHDDAPDRRIGVVAGLWAAAAGATTLAWTGQLVTAALILAAVAIGAVVTQRVRPDPLVTATLNVVAAGFAAVVGYLVVPGGPGAANVLLGAAAAATAAVLLLRVTGCGTVVLTAITVVGTMVTLALCPAAVWTVPMAMVGAALATAALGVLGVAARLAIMVAGLTPPMPTGAPADDDPAVSEQAALGHHTLTGIVVGAATLAAAGAVLVMTAGLRTGVWWLPAAAFTAVIGLAFLLRTRSHVDVRRRVPLVVSGILSATATFTLAAVRLPGAVHWVAVLVIGVGLGALAGQPASPIVRRAADLMEYLALAAAIPLACWVADLYSLVRTVSLP